MTIAALLHTQEVNIDNLKKEKKTLDLNIKYVACVCVYLCTAWRTCLDEFVEGNGAVSVRVGLLDGSVRDAPQLLVRNVHANHHS